MPEFQRIANVRITLFQHVQKNDLKTNELSLHDTEPPKGQGGNDYFRGGKLFIIITILCFLAIFFHSLAISFVFAHKAFITLL